MTETEICEKQKSVRMDWQKKNVIISFRIANVAGIGTFAGTLRYLRTLANWKVRLFTSQAELSPEIVDAAIKEGIDGILIDHPLHETLADILLNSSIPLVTIGNTDDVFSSADIMLRSLKWTTARSAKKAPSTSIHSGTSDRSVSCPTSRNPAGQ